MKLFLSSAGLATKELREWFRVFVGKDPEHVRIAFIPTAANVIPEHPWLLRDIENIRAGAFRQIEIVDLDKLDGKEAIEKCEAADVIWMNGGNTYYLLQWVRRSGLANELRRLLKTRVYAGVSAGSMIAGPTIETNQHFFPEEEGCRTEDLNGLGLVPFSVIPHLGSSAFPLITRERVKRFATGVSYPVYGIDDASAVEVFMGKVTCRTSGVMLRCNAG